MKISLMDSKSTARRLSALIQKHSRISMAVAWGGMMPVAEALLANRAKFEFVLLGVDFSATDPDLIDALVGVPNAFVAKGHQGCFHPKIFYFHSGDEADAIVGSANFTRGGLNTNMEASVHVRGTRDDQLFRQIQEQLDLYKELSYPITQSLADSYRRQSIAASRLPRPKNPVLPGEGKDWMRINSPLGIMQWREFSQLARRDLHHDFDNRMTLIRTIQQIFNKSKSFAALPTAEAKAIAGVLGDLEAEREGLDGIEWAWFGSMGAAGTFAKLVGLADQAVGAALDAIPKRGDVTEAQFDDYVAAFTAAFSGYPRTARLAPATRLLAMKRPDRFVCVNGDNRTGLATALAFAPTTIDLENYWERVIEPIQQAPWYNTPRPMGRDMELWDARVAMLDAIYYRPRPKAGHSA